MASKQTVHNLKVVAIILAFVGLSSLVLIESGIVANVFDRQPSYDKELLSSVSLKGQVRAEDLNLSSGEIKQINFAALKYNKTFSQMDLNLNYAAKEGSREIFPETKLVMDLRLQVDDGGEICSWSQEVSRDRVVPTMVEYIDKAAIEFRKYKKLDGAKAVFKRLYI